MRTVAGANVGGLILGTATFSLFLMLTLYMQQVLGYSPMKTGVAYLAVAGSAIVWSVVAAQLVTRIGVKPVLVTGMVALTSGLVYFTQVSVHGTYLSDLLPGFLLVGVGLGFSFVPISIAALAGVDRPDLLTRHVPDLGGLPGLDGQAVEDVALLIAFDLRDRAQDDAIGSDHVPPLRDLQPRDRISHPLATLALRRGTNRCPPETASRILI